MLPSQTADPRRRAALLAVWFAVAAAAACGPSTATSVAGPTPPRCQVTLAGSPSTFPASGGSGTLTVTTDRDCTWTATAGASWIALSGSTSGQGPAQFPFSVAANSAVATRSSNIAVNGQTFSLSEQPASCSFAVSPSALSVASTGATSAVSVQAQSGCAWTSASAADWIAIASGASGNGTGTVQLTVAANSGAARSGTAIVAGQSITVSQSAGAAPPPPPSCSFSIAPTGQTFGSGGGAGAVTVTAGGGCAWTATSSVPWVTISSGSAGTGSGVVAFAVAANDGPARSASLAIADQVFAVNQSAGGGRLACNFSVSPATQSFPADGGTGTTSVLTSNGCTWTAMGGASWVTITSGASGTGPGTVAFAVGSNTGSARATTLTIAGQTFTVSQDATPCTYSVSPQNAAVNAFGGSGILTITVTTGNGCPWTAASSVPWMTVDSGAAGTGPGTVVASVAQNTGAARAGNLAVAGQTVTISQGAATPGSVSGVISNLAGACPALSFLVSAVLVETNATTAFLRGSCQRLDNGVGVGVQGVVQADSSLLATQVTIQRH